MILGPSHESLGLLGGFQWSGWKQLEPPPPVHLKHHDPAEPILMPPKVAIQGLQLNNITTPERCMFRTFSTTLLPHMAHPSAPLTLPASDWCFSLQIQACSILPRAADQASFGETGDEAGSPMLI